MSWKLGLMLMMRSNFKTCEWFVIGFMTYYKLECENKKGGISIIPVYPLSVIPYKILDEKSVLLKIQLKVKSKYQQLMEMIFF